MKVGARMRDINRIDNFLNEIGKIWKKYPDLRFAQFITNLTMYRTDLYYVEEDEFLSILKEFYLEEDSE